MKDKKANDLPVLIVDNEGKTIRVEWLEDPRNSFVNFYNQNASLTGRHAQLPRPGWSSPDVQRISDVT